MQILSYKLIELSVLYSHLKSMKFVVC